MTDPITRLNAALEGRYRIERELGEGGMATVYLADDLRHERKVALKVLKPELAAVVGAERFLAEIKTTANLQHPHILALFDSGEADGFLFYVMPYVEGESLRDKIDREKQLSVEDALAITKKVASALDHAHRNGVVHRDIKPGNILLNPEGQPTVADFGIALAVAQAGGGRVTETGLSVGTPHYMSPEQATGDRDVDPRTDIYALGCVLYEMLVGEPPYTGSTAQAVLGKIIQGETVSATDARSTVPPNVDAAIRKALEKLPADRFGTATEFATALADPGFRYGELAATVSMAAVGPWRRLAFTLAGVALVSILSTSWALLRPTPSPPLTRLEVSLQDGLEFDPAGGVNAAISPDGSRIVFVGTAAETNEIQLWQRPLSQLVAVAIPGTEGAREPRFSPDGQSVAFHRVSSTQVSGSLHTVDLAGGVPRTLVSDSVRGDQSWGPDGWIYFNKVGRGIWRVPETGGPEEEVTVREPGGAEQGFVDVLPGGHGFLYTEMTGQTSGNSVAVASTSTGETRVLFDGQAGRYAASGHVVFVSPEGRLAAVPFDARRLETTGPPVVLDESVWDGRQFALSEQGHLLYLEGSGGAVTGLQLVVVDLDGNEEPLVLGPRNIEDASVTWSPDGGSIVYASNEQIYTYNVVLGTTPRQLTYDGENGLPVFSPDGNRVAFSSRRAGTDGVDLFVKDVGSDAPPTSLITRQGDQWVTQWPSDTLIVFEDDQGSEDLWTLNISDPASPVAEEYLASEARLQRMVVSPDGTLAAYQSNESGSFEVYIRSFPTPGERTLVSAGGGGLPYWSPDGGTLYHFQGENNPVVEVRLGRDPDPVVLSREELRAVVTAAVEPSPGAGLHPDGDRFIFARRVDSGTPSSAGGSNRLILVQNFFEELREVVGN